jgi:hypothetical protein
MPVEPRMSANRTLISTSAPPGIFRIWPKQALQRSGFELDEPCMTTRVSTRPRPRNGAAHNLHRGEDGTCPHIRLRRGSPGSVPFRTWRQSSPCFPSGSAVRTSSIATDVTPPPRLTPASRCQPAGTASGSVTDVGKPSSSGSVQVHAAPWNRPTAPCRAASTRSGSPKISMNPTAAA